MNPKPYTLNQVRDCRNIIFRDLGDRVAMLVRLQIPVVGTDGAEDTGEVVVVNTHLLFPHKPYFSIIRLRELRKILGFLELYRLLHRSQPPPVPRPSSAHLFEPHVDYTMSPDCV